jgi:hypothetical protein
LSNEFDQTLWAAAKVPPSSFGWIPKLCHSIMNHDNPSPPPVKTALILDEAPGAFRLQYEDTLGRKLTMRLDALTYEQALRESRSFLGIQDDDLDEAGDRWTML